MLDVRQAEAHMYSPDWLFKFASPADGATLTARLDVEVDAGMSGVGLPCLSTGIGRIRRHSGQIRSDLCLSLASPEWVGHPGSRWSATRRLPAEAGAEPCAKAKLVGQWS